MRRPLSRSARRDRVTTRNNDNVARVLITGMSGAGKSSVLQELARPGFRVVDTDYGDYHETADGERLWRDDRVGLGGECRRRCGVGRRRRGRRGCY